MAEYKFYMSRFINNEWETPISLEDFFHGLKYVSCNGLSDYGKIKSIYTENYAETDELRLYLSDKTVRENTDIEFVFGFEYENRREVYDSFVNWISGYKIRYWDTCRNREVDMVLIDKIEIGEDVLIGSSPFITAPFKFKNLNGQTSKSATAPPDEEDNRGYMMYNSLDYVLW